MTDVRASTVALRGHLLDVDRELAAKGLAAPALAFGFSFTILFREGVEAVLLIAILLGSLAAGQVQGYKRPLGLGVLGAVVATAATWVVATVALDLAPVNRELLEAITALAAVAVLVLVSFWLVQRLEHRRRMEFMRARTAAAIAAGSSAAFAGLGFTAVYREGFETVLFYQALSLFAEGLGLWVWLGAATAAAALAAVALGHPAPRREAPAQADAAHRRERPAAAQRRLRRQRGALAAGGRPGHGLARPRRLGPAARVRRRADGHPPDGPGPRRAGGAPGGVRRSARRGSSALRRRCAGAVRRRRSARHDPRGGPARRRRRRRHVHEGGRGAGAPRRAAGPRGRPHEPPRARGRRRGRRRGRCASCSARSARPATRSSSSPSRRRRR